MTNFYRISFPLEGLNIKISFLLYLSLITCDLLFRYEKLKTPKGTLKNHWKFKIGAGCRSLKLFSFPPLNVNV